MKCSVVLCCVVMWCGVLLCVLCVVLLCVWCFVCCCINALLCPRVPAAMTLALTCSLGTRDLHEVLFEELVECAFPNMVRSRMRML